MKRFFFWLVPMVLLIGVVALYWPTSESPRIEEPESESLAASAPPPEPSIRYPVEPDESPPVVLPPLAESDGQMRDALAAVLGQRPPEFLNLRNIIHRVVATVDNLPRDHLAPRLMPLKPVTGIPVTEEMNEGLVLSSRNAARYNAYVRLAEAVPTGVLIAAYARFYPLFQEQYEKLGYPDKYFNDRAVEVIDHLLATPEVAEPLRLVQPRIVYEFADPKLQQLSAGQKILLRIGKVNRSKLKSKLQELRQALVSMAPAKIIAVP